LLSPLLQVSVRYIGFMLVGSRSIFVHQFCALTLFTCKLEQYSRIIKPVTSHYFSHLELRSDTAPEYTHTVCKRTSSIGSLCYRLSMSKRRTRCKMDYFKRTVFKSCHLFDLIYFYKVRMWLYNAMLAGWRPHSLPAFD
jgi:hypothetical protein